MRVFFDTNVLVGAFTTRGLSAELFCLVIAEHELLTGEGNLTAFRRVLRERLKVPPGALAFAEDQLRAHTIVARPVPPADLRLGEVEGGGVLAAALAAGAELLVTGARGLLGGAERAPLTILDPRGCWDRLRRLLT